MQKLWESRPLTNSASISGNVRLVCVQRVCLLTHRNRTSVTGITSEGTVTIKALVQELSVRVGERCKGRSLHTPLSKLCPWVDMPAGSLTTCPVHGSAGGVWHCARRGGCDAVDIGGMWHCRRAGWGGRRVLILVDERDGVWLRRRQACALPSARGKIF